ncbi:DNA-(apurinic or apyrimidinic site) endonuclease 2 [Mustelus asterias]
METGLRSGSGPGLCLVCWNVNGIRARGKRLLPLLQRLQADIICLQETKVTRDLLDEPTAVVQGFNSYFSYSRGRSGYSGVATFCKDSVIPFAAEEGLSGILANQGGTPASCVLEGFSDEELRALDGEGRAMITKHRIRTCGEEEEILTVINVYCPRADPEREDRSHFKLRFYQLLQARTEALLQEGGNVIVLGDMNTAHRPIDHCQPGELDCFDKHPDRVWLNGFLSCPSELSRLDQANEISDPAPGLGVRGGNGSGLLVDAFRLFHPSEREAYTCWRTSTGARKTNYGTRIDYIFANKSLAESILQDCVLMPEIEGSDHCPVRAVLKARCVPADKCPPLCTKYMPEFAGLQQKLSQFLVNVQDSQVVPEPWNNPGTERRSQPQVDPRTKEGKVAGRRTGRCLMRGRGTRGKADPRLSGSLLRFFKPAPASTSPALEVRDDLRLSSQVALTVGTHRPAQDKEVNQDTGAKEQKSESQAGFWKSLLKGLPPPPHCSGHQEPCLLRTVRKPGSNQGRQFYICPRPEGPLSNPASRCNFFRWAKAT